MSISGTEHNRLLDEIKRLRGLLREARSSIPGNHTFTLRRIDAFLTPAPIETHADWCVTMDSDKWRTQPSTCDCGAAADQPKVCPACEGAGFTGLGNVCKKCGGATNPLATDGTTVGCPDCGCGQWYVSAEVEQCRNCGYARPRQAEGWTRVEVWIPRHLVPKLRAYVKQLTARTSEND